ncbi:N-acylneuraminate-9-phosphatase [Hondaea fermentalgiana]|uniref:N-acylneuraminate-9-phosphatase n=1 Tax=Hondaea fermentalgiana TaxID=2315210 RepID=A0A2R5GR46_9STRA|nr:N-acylneuraminate-9-phosphatase [Hondaea fermentalgiana]|eukprot:GBG33357.1 N-acylneuraminate-9-phosphatase [Hondaea fermentalgiana]
MAAREARQFAPDLVIFDKDGTLIDFKFMWGRWAEKLCARLEDQGHLNREAMQLFTEALGYNRTEGTVHNRSPICCSPMHNIEEICVEFVSSHMGSNRRDEAVEAIRKAWHMPNPETDTRALTDLHDLFSFLRKERGSKIAVCTTDDRDVTETTLAWLKVDHLVDQVVCGDDAHLPPKPNPEQIFHICDRLGVEPRNTVMVGDTITDMSMGHAAQVGLRIGIPNGAGSLEDLSQHADFILPSMNNFKRVFQQLTLPPRR